MVLSKPYKVLIIVKYFFCFQIILNLVKNGLIKIKLIFMNQNSNINKGIIKILFFLNNLQIFFEYYVQ